MEKIHVLSGSQKNLKTLVEDFLFTTHVITDQLNYAGLGIEVFEVKEVGAHISPGIFGLLRILKPFAVTRSNLEIAD